MPVRQLDGYLAEAGIVRHEPLAALRGARLAVDAPYWLRRLMKRLPTEPLLEATGGLPATLTAAIDKELKAASSAGLTLTFVFPGLSLAKRDDPFALVDNRPTLRSDGWAYYHRGQVDAAKQSWANVGAAPAADVHGHFLRLLHEQRVDVIRAPYTVAAQLAAFDLTAGGPVHGVYTSADVLMFRNVGRVLLSINHEKGQFEWVDRREMLRALALNDTQFADACHLAGHEGCPPLPIDDGHELSFKSAYQLVREHRSAVAVVERAGFGERVAKMNYFSILAKAQVATTFCAVITDSATVAPLSRGQPPPDLHEIIGVHLPDEVYLLLALGIGSLPVMNAYTSGMWIEHRPLCNGDEVDYQRLLHALEVPRSDALALVASALTRMGFVQRDMSIWYWFESAPRRLQHFSKSILPARVRALSVPDTQFLHAQLPGRDVRVATSLRSVLIVQAVRAGDTSTLPKPVSPKHVGSALSPANEGHLAQTLYRYAILRDMVQLDHTVTPFGSAWLAGLDAAVPPATKSGGGVATVDDEVLLALELARMQALHADEFRMVPGVSTYPSIADRRVRLLARVFSLARVQLKAQPYNGPVNRELLTFHSMATAVRRTLRQLAETTLLAYAVDVVDSARKSRRDLSPLIDRMPFAREYSTLGGLLLLHHFGALDTSVKPASWATVFPTCTDPVGDLRRGYDLWHQVYTAVTTYGDATDEIESTVLEDFHAAHQLLLATPPPPAASAPTLVAAASSTPAHGPRPTANAT